MLVRVVMLLVMAVATTRPANPIGEAIDPDDGDAITADGDRVTIVTADTPHDFAAELQQWNAPRVLSKAEGDFTLEVKVSGTFAPENVTTIAGRTPYNGAGLLVVADDQNHLSLQRTALFKQRSGPPLPELGIAKRWKAFNVAVADELERRRRVTALLAAREPVRSLRERGWEDLASVQTDPSGFSGRATGGRRGGEFDGQRVPMRVRGFQTLARRCGREHNEPTQAEPMDSAILAEIM